MRTAGALSRQGALRPAELSGPAADTADFLREPAERKAKAERSHWLTATATATATAPPLHRDAAERLVVIEAICP